MTLAEVRSAAGEPTSRFKKTTESASLTDAYEDLGLHVYYNRSGSVEFVESFQVDQTLHVLGSMPVFKTVAEELVASLSANAPFRSEEGGSLYVCPFLGLSLWRSDSSGEAGPDASPYPPTTVQQCNRARRFGHRRTLVAVRGRSGRCRSRGVALLQVSAGVKRQRGGGALLWTRAILGPSRDRGPASGLIVCQLCANSAEVPRFRPNSLVERMGNSIRKSNT